MLSAAPEDQNESLSVPWPDTVRFIRQLSHDLRNHLNAIELQSAYIGELADKPELKEEIKRLRDMISRLTSALQKLSAGLGEIKPNLISYPASDFVEDLRKRTAREFPENISEITWEVEVGNAILHIDPELLTQAFIELFANAFRHGRGKDNLVAAVRIEGKRFVFTIQEPKKQFELSTENWGREPLREISQTHYGLGLNRVHVILEAHGGEMHAQYDSNASMLVTTLTLPLVREKA
jgi:K+-sensing histidine kinase KdpD